MLLAVAAALAAPVVVWTARPSGVVADAYVSALAIDWTNADFGGPGRVTAVDLRTLRDAETLLLQRAPLAPIYFNAKIWLMSPRVRGWQEDGLWGRCYQGIYLLP